MISQYMIYVLQLLFGYAINEALDNLNKDTFPLPFVPNDRVAFKS